MNRLHENFFAEPVFLCDLTCAFWSKLYNVAIMDCETLPNDIDACHALLKGQAVALEQQATELSLRDKLIEEQAHSVLEVKADHDKLDEKVTELNLTIETLLKQLYGRKSERRVDGEGQLFLNLGEDPTPEVVSALEDAIRDAQETVDDAEEAKKKQKKKRPRKSVPEKAIASSPATYRDTKRPSTCPKTNAKASR